MMLLLLMAVGSVAFAIPAKREAVTIRQPNGKMLTFVLGGDETVNWAKTIDQYTLVRNQEGFFTYGILDENGDLVAYQGIYEVEGNTPKYVGAFKIENGKVVKVN